MRALEGGLERGASLGVALGGGFFRLAKRRVRVRGGGGDAEATKRHGGRQWGRGRARTCAHVALFADIFYIASLEVFYYLSVHIRTVRIPIYQRNGKGPFVNVCIFRETTESYHVSEGRMRA